MTAKLRASLHLQVLANGLAGPFNERKQVKVTWNSRRAAAFVNG
jgi:hypothetical protein